MNFQPNDVKLNKEKKLKQELHLFITKTYLQL
jgi:hypothetical protein